MPLFQGLQGLRVGWHIPGQATVSGRRGGRIEGRKDCRASSAFLFGGVGVIDKIRPAEVRPAEVRLVEVRLAEVRQDVGVRLTPRVPGGHALHSNNSMGETFYFKSAIRVSVAISHQRWQG
jgi:hypothetical protein